MDFTPTEMQGAIQDLARQVLQADEPWPHLAEAGLLEVEDLQDLVVLMEQVGRTGGRVPVLETLVLGAPIRESGVEVDAHAVLTAGLVEAGSRDPRFVATVAVDGRLTGTKLCVPAATVASHLVVPAQDGLYCVALADCAVTPQTGTNGDVQGTVVLDGAPGVKLGGPEAIGPWLQRIQVCTAALLLGLSRQALVMTARYVTDRQQFGVPIATFQAVSQRAADAWITVQAMELTMQQAAWRLSEGLPAEREVIIAAQVAADGAHGVVAAAQHLHGGMGFDRDYALHRYFLTVKAWEFVLGGGSENLDRLGDLLAAR